MKTAISMPDSIFKAAEELAKRLGISWSALYTKAVKDFIRAHTNDGVAEVLNKLYGEESSSLDPVLQAIQRVSLKEEDW